MRFAGKVAVVTGAASGIGKQIAHDLLAEGATVLAFDLREAELERAFAPEQRDAVTFIGGNICNHEDRAAILRRGEQLGGIDYVVNAAGIVRTVELLDVTEEVWDLVLDVNAKACFFMCQMVAKHWLATGKQGAMINFSSSAGKTASTLQIAPYNASKASVIAITKTFAHALAASGSRVNCVCPGIIDTPMQSQIVNQLSAQTGAHMQSILDDRVRPVPLKRAGTVEEVSKVVQFLLSDDAAYMTGQAINITGGLVMY